MTIPTRSTLTPIEPPKTTADGKLPLDALTKVRAVQTVAIQFIPVKDYTTFAAEYSVAEGDIIYHFFVTDEVNALASPRTYWHESFPQVLEKTAQEFFKAKFPRLKAAYTEEKASWWMRAYGFGRVLHPQTRAKGFLVELDKQLDPILLAGRRQ